MILLAALALGRALVVGAVDPIALGGLVVGLVGAVTATVSKIRGDRIAERTVGREELESALEVVRRDRDEVRQEVRVLREENRDLYNQLGDARADLRHMRDAMAGVEGEVRKCHQERELLRVELDRLGGG